MADSQHEFYVGYLPVPHAQRRFLTRIVPLLLLVFLGVGLWIGRSQPNPGTGVWEDGHEREWVGRAVALPYPHLQRSDEPGAILLVVEIGKFGGGQRLTAFDGQHVRIRGFLLHRDGREMIELSEGPEAIVAEPGPLPAALAYQPGESLELQGEIVDSKCYLGAMKPGDGKTHKACATLCIAGGIPPVLVVHQPQGRRYYLLSDPQGQPLADAVLPLVGEAVRVRGQSGTLGNWRTLRCEVEQIERR